MIDDLHFSIKNATLKVAFTHGVISSDRNPFTFRQFFCVIFLTKNIDSKVASATFGINSKSKSSYLRHIFVIFSDVFTVNTIGSLTVIF